MKKVIWIVVVVLVVLFISGSCSAYNRMVTAEETVIRLGPMSRRSTSVVPT